MEQEAGSAREKMMTPPTPPPTPGAPHPLHVFKKLPSLVCETRDLHQHQITDWKVQGLRVYAYS